MQLLAFEFPTVPASIIRKALETSFNKLSPAYSALCRLPLDTPKSTGRLYPEESTEIMWGRRLGGERMLVIPAPELRATLTALHLPNTLHSQILHAELMEARHRWMEMKECECCYEKRPLKQMVMCAGSLTRKRKSSDDSAGPDRKHLFCIQCLQMEAARMSEQGKWQVLCLGGCASEFARDDQKRFIDAKTQQVFDNFEVRTVLRVANIDSLAECPFCVYGEIYPPVDEIATFFCRRCAIRSCRLCSKKQHPQRPCNEITVEESRHQIAEARTEALVRRCNNCRMPFIREGGCNKVWRLQVDRETRLFVDADRFDQMKCPHCRHTQCYVCGQSADYNHFSVAGAGCPLEDNPEARHTTDVAQADQHERARILEKFPDLDPAALEMAVSAAVQQDDKARADAAQKAMRTFVRENGALRPLAQPYDQRQFDEDRMLWARERYLQQRHIQAAHNMLMDLQVGGHMYQFARHNQALAPVAEDAAPQRGNFGDVGVQLPQVPPPVARRAGAQAQLEAAGNGGLQAQLEAAGNGGLQALPRELGDNQLQAVDNPLRAHMEHANAHVQQHAAVLNAELQLLAKRQQEFLEQHGHLDMPREKRRNLGVAQGEQPGGRLVHHKEQQQQQQGQKQQEEQQQQQEQEEQ
jgi:hypothetical protein